MFGSRLARAERQRHGGEQDGADNHLSGVPSIGDAFMSRTCRARSIVLPKGHLLPVCSIAVSAPKAAQAISGKMAKRRITFKCASALDLKNRLHLHGGAGGKLREAERAP